MTCQIGLKGISKESCAVDGMYSASLVQIGASGRDILSSWTAISPNVPCSFEALLGPHSANLRTCDTFVVAVVPLANVFRNFDLGATFKAIRLAAAVRLPR